jgi:hypothetical protein
MTDTTTNQPIHVLDGGEGRPHLILPAVLLEQACKVLDGNGIRYSVSPTIISIDGKPATAWIFLKHLTDPNHVLALLQPLQTEEGQIDEDSSAAITSQKLAAAMAEQRNGTQGDQATTRDPMSSNLRGGNAAGEVNGKNPTNPARPVQVFDGGTAGPYVILLASLVERVRKILDDNRIRYRVCHTVISVDGKPATTCIFLAPQTDLDHAQSLLDAA